MSSNTPISSILAACAMVAVAATQVACTNKCGTYELILPETEQVDDRFKRNPFELCDSDAGSQGGDFKDGTSYITFQPTDGAMSGSFVYTNMLITAVFPTEEVVTGTTVTGNTIGGNAFYGLGHSRHYDEVPLNSEDSWITFHDVDDETGDGLHRKRLIDVEWYLVWEGNESRWFAEGRKDMPFLRSTR